MRVVFVAWHGSEHTQRWVSFFAHRGHEVDVVTCGDAPTAPPRGYRVHDLGVPRFGKLGYFAKIPAARRTIRRLAPDVVHAHYATSYGLLALASGRRPLVVTAHGSDLLRSPRNPLLRVVVTRVLRAASLVTVPSEEMRDAIRRLAGDGPRVLVLQYGVEVDELAVLGDRLRPPREGPLRIISVRHLDRVYRVDLLLHALARLVDAGVDFRCDIAGGGPERAQLEQLGAELGLGDRVVFHGRLAPDEVVELMARAQLYVSLAESDGLSISLLEALALGLVPVLRDIHANSSWVVDGDGGALVGGTDEDVADGIVRAAALDAEAARQRNRALVRERADRATNLGRVETELRALLESAS